MHRPRWSVIALRDWSGWLLAMSPISLAAAVFIASYITGLVATATTFPAWILLCLLISGTAVVGLLVYRTGRLVMRQLRQIDPMAHSFDNERIVIADLVRDTGQPLLRGRTFVDCHINGPAVLWMKDGAGNIIDDAHINAPYEAIKLRVDVTPDLPVVGSIICQRCIFRGCTFDRIAFLGGDEVGLQLQRATRTVEAAAPGS